uniref:exosortase F system-associated membrane protein n=1 Tax=Aegicerativicinus sediminis TaxID=2893202 RepID=UPI001E622480|nr:exosortase F system-associated protein [Aegicerativicinus sediminis]
MMRLSFKDYGLLFILFSLLVAIRFFENELFYDPYLKFFRDDYLRIDSPRREVAKLTFFTGLRYFLNSAISIGILFIIFKRKSVVSFSLILYGVSFLFLIGIYLYFVINPRQEDYYMFFYFRRFLIQPIFLIVLLPAFYYHFLKKVKT